MWQAEKREFSMTTRPTLKRKWTINSVTIPFSDNDDLPVQKLKVVQWRSVSVVLVLSHDFEWPPPFAAQCPEQRIPFTLNWSFLFITLKWKIRGWDSDPFGSSICFFSFSYSLLVSLLRACFLLELSKTRLPANGWPSRPPLSLSSR